MAAVSYIKIKSGFADETTRDLTMGPFATSAVANVKPAIKALKNDPSAIANIYKSDSGAAFTGILGAEIITENVTEINLN